MAIIDNDVGFYRLGVKKFPRGNAERLIKTTAKPRRNVKPSTRKNAHRYRKKSAKMSK